MNLEFRTNQNNLIVILSDEAAKLAYEFISKSENFDKTENGFKANKNSYINNYNQKAYLVKDDYIIVYE